MSKAAVTRPPTEEAMENLNYLFAAYSIIFGAIFLYVMFLWRRQANLEQKLRNLEKQLGVLSDALASETGQTG
jgi:CcmD family protein